MTEARMISLIYSSAIVFVGLIQVFINSFSKKGYVYGARPGEDLREYKKLDNLSRSYKFYTLILTLVLGLGQYFLSYITNSVGFLTLFFLISLMVLCVPLFIANKKLKDIGSQRPPKKKLVLANFNIWDHMERKVLIFGYGLSILIILITSLVLLINYESLPDRLIMQVGFDGEINNIEDKTYFNVLFPSLISLAMTFLFIFINKKVLENKPRISKEDPERALADNIRAKKYWSLYFIISNLVLTLLMEVGVNIFSMGGGLGPIYVFLALSVLVSLGGAVFLGLRVGIDGSRLNDLAYETYEEDDAFWPLGATIYYNPDDPRVFVPKRIGVGMTVNLGSLGGKVLMGLSLVLIIASLIFLFIYE